VKQIKTMCRDIHFVIYTDVTSGLVILWKRHLGQVLGHVDQGLIEYELQVMW